MPPLSDLTAQERVSELASAYVEAMEVVGAAAAELGRLVDEVSERVAAGGRIIYVGAGTSGRLAQLDAVEVGPTFDMDVVVALVAVASADEDDAAAGGAAVAGLIPRDPDIVIGVSASGSTPFVVAAVQVAIEAGCGTAALVNTADSQLAGLVDHPVLLSTGAEPIGGSTRMLAGIAQHAALTIFSTAVMVQLGRAPGNRMVFVRAENAKLAARARRLRGE